jgi:hypothetical protein
MMMFEKLKKRWNIKSNFQVVVILVVFALTGSTTVYVKKLFYDFIGITPDTGLWIKILIYLPVILIIYNILLLIYGFIFGQFRFFWEFEKKFFSRIFFLRKVSVSIKNEK